MDNLKSSPIKIYANNQAELDAIPPDYTGQIIIKFGTEAEPAILRGTWLRPVIVRDSFWVKAGGNACVCASEYANIKAWDASKVFATENATVWAWDHSTVQAKNYCTVFARDSAEVTALGYCVISALQSCKVKAYGNCLVRAAHYASVDAYGNSQVIHTLGYRGHPSYHGKARGVCEPSGVMAYIDFFGLPYEGEAPIGKFYKAVHVVDRERGLYVSNWDSKFYYRIGETVEQRCDDNVFEDCSYGIHLSHMLFALFWGRDWSNLAILELESNLADIIVPIDNCGKVRTSKAKVIREVPLEECGVYGQFLAMHKNADALYNAKLEKGDHI